MRQEVKWSISHSDMKWDLIVPSPTLCFPIPSGRIPMAGHWLTKAREQRVGEDEPVHKPVLSEVRSYRQQLFPNLSSPHISQSPNSCRSQRYRKLSVSDLLGVFWEAIPSQLKAVGPKVWSQTITRVTSPVLHWALDTQKMSSADRHETTLLGTLPWDPQRLGISIGPWLRSSVCLRSIHLFG